MLAAMKVFGCMLVLGGVAAAHVSAGEAKPEMNPAVSHLQAFLTAIAVRLVVLCGIQMIACVGHGLYREAMIRLAPIGRSVRRRQSRSRWRR